MNKVRFQLYFLGASLWMPGIALFSIENLWGLQITICILGTLLLSLFVSCLSNKVTLSSINTYQEWMLSHYFFLFSIVLCTVFSSVGFERSIKTFGVELIGLIFSLTITWWLCQDTRNFTSFIDGFKLGGIFSSVYAIYQLIGLRMNLPFAYIEMNNSSFSVVGLEYSEDILRSFGLTPEPSVLASLLWTMIGVALIDLLNIGGFKRYFVFSCTLMGLMSTSSQSIPLLPVYIVFIFFINRQISNKLRPFSVSDTVGVSVLLLSLFCLLYTNQSILFWLSRAGNINDNVSGTMRLNDLIIGASMFADSPIFGLGLGSSSDVIDKFSSKLSMYTSKSAGITSGFMRVVAEQGIAGVTSMIFSLYCIVPRKLERIKLSCTSSSIVGYQLSFVISGISSLMLFIGYRNLYHLWLILPMGIAMKSYLKSLNKKMLTSEY